MAEEFYQGGICGGTWWNPPRSTLFYGGITSPCSAAQLGGSFDMGTFGWPNDVSVKGNNNKDVNYVHNNSFDNSLIFQADVDSSTLDMLGFGLSPISSTSTDWSQLNLLMNDVNYGPILVEDENFKINPSNIVNSNNSPPSVGSGDSSSMSSEGGLITNSYLIQTLFEDTDDSQVIEPQLPISQHINNSNYVHSSVMDSLGQNNECHGRMNDQYSSTTALSNIRASLLNSIKSRSRVPPTQSCAEVATNKVNMEEVHNSKGNLNNQPPSKRPRIETPSSLPSFKVRKEKLGDRITALQQLVSPFGKTDTASVLHEAIEYIKFLHDQVNVLSSPSLENGAPMHHNQEFNIEQREDLRSRGLCLVPISSTYPIVQETSVDFWTPTFGGQEHIIQRTDLNDCIYPN